MNSRQFILTTNPVAITNRIQATMVVKTHVQLVSRLAIFRFRLQRLETAQLNGGTS